MLSRVWPSHMCHVYDHDNTTTCVFILSNTSVISMWSLWQDLYILSWFTTPCQQASYCAQPVNLREIAETNILVIQFRWGTARYWTRMPHQALVNTKNTLIVHKVWKINARQQLILLERRQMSPSQSKCYALLYDETIGSLIIASWLHNLLYKSMNVGF